MKALIVINHDLLTAENEIISTIIEFSLETKEISTVETIRESGEKHFIQTPSNGLRNYLQELLFEDLAANIMAYRIYETNTRKNTNDQVHSEQKAEQNTTNTDKIKDQKLQETS